MLDGIGSVYDGLEVLIPLAMVPVAARMHRPTVAVAWILSSVVLPVVTVLAYLYFNVYRLRMRERRYARGREAARDWAGRGEPRGAAVVEQKDPLMLVTERASDARPGGTAAVGGNRVDVLDDPIERLIADVDAARDHVHLLYYIFADDQVGRRVADALMRASGRGVACRLLAGSYASHWEGPSLFTELGPQLEAAGVRVVPLAPVNPLRARLSRVDLRNHRKIATIDGEVGHIGSMNVHGDDLCGVGPWHDLVVRLTGPVVAQLEGIFAQDWQFETGAALPADQLVRDGAPRGEQTVQILSSGPSRDHDSPVVHVFVSAFGAATREIVTTTPYLVLDDALTVAFATAAQRGITVKVILPRRADRWYLDAAARASVEPLLRAGVELYLHEDGMLHAKTISIDERIAIVGSTNCDMRSCYLNFEASAILYDEAAAAAVRAAQGRLLAHATRLAPEELLGRSSWRKTVDHTVMLLAPLL